LEVNLKKYLQEIKLLKSLEKCEFFNLGEL